MKVAIVFSPSIEPDPLDAHAQERSLGEFIDTDKGIDVLLVWREWGEQFEGGSRTHVISSGTWENITPEQVDATLDALSE